MKRSSKILLGTVVLIVLVIVLIVSNKSSNTGPIKIGWIGPLTGDGATLGQNAKDAVSLAVKEINDSGGINGRQIQVIYEDGKCTGANASGAASKLINIDKVTMILGGACSGETSAFVNMARQSNMPVLSYCSSAPSLTGSGIFRLVPSDSHAGSYTAEYIFNTLKIKKVAAMYEQTDYTQGIHDVFVAEFKKLGGTISNDESFNKDVRDFKTQLAKIKDANPDLIYFLAYAEQTIPALKQIHDMDIKAKLFGADAWSDPSIPEKSGTAANGITFLGLAAHNNKDFMAKMASSTGSVTIGECSAPAYDGMKIIAQVLKTAGTDPDAIKKAMSEVDYKGGAAYYEIKFDSNGDLIGSHYMVTQIKDGKPVVIMTP